MHIRKFNVKRDIPIGNISASNPDVLPNGSSKGASVEVDIPQAEAEVFELWLRDLWREKDKLMTRFLETGYLNPAAEQAATGGSTSAGVVVPVRLRHSYEVLDAFCFFVPAVVGWAWSKVRW